MITHTTEHSNTVASYVNKVAPTLVVPFGTTPTGHLPLSDLDRLPFNMAHMEAIVVFDHGNEAVEVVRAALAKALVPYFPVAGRIAAETYGGVLGVTCTGEGVWFVEATSDFRLEDVDELKQEPLLIPKEHLLPSPPEEVEALALPFIMQVTQFKCGGFVLGIKFNHAFFDGKGVGQLIIAIGDMARGLAEPAIKPVWCRDVLRVPIPKIPTQKELIQSTKEEAIELVHIVVDIPMDRIDEQKYRFMEETGKNCTTFDIVAAKLWRTRTQITGLPHHVAVSFASLASVRHLHAELPQGGGYYGNCLAPIDVEAPSWKIANTSLFDIVRLIKEAKECLPTKYSRMLDGLELPPMMANTYGNLALVDWRRLGFHEADFGWGGPSHVVPLTENKGRFGAGCLTNLPVPKKGVCVMGRLVAEEHREAFLSQMHDWS